MYGFGLPRYKISGFRDLRSYEIRGGRVGGRVFGGFAGGVLAIFGFMCLRGFLGGVLENSGCKKLSGCVGLEAWVVGDG